MQLEFKCPECRAAGLTPDLPEDKAIAVTLGQLRRGCPHCSSIIEITEPRAQVLARAKVSAAAAAGESLSEWFARLSRQRWSGEQQRKNSMQHSEPTRRWSEWLARYAVGEFERHGRASHRSPLR